MKAATDRRAVLGAIMTAGAYLSLPSWAGSGALVADPVLAAIERHRQAYAAFMEGLGPDERVRSLRSREGRRRRSGGAATVQRA
jgi:hypothetical protein